MLHDKPKVLRRVVASLNEKVFILLIISKGMKMKLIDISEKDVAVST